MDRLLRKLHGLAEVFVYLGCFITPEQIAASSSIIGFKFSKWPFILNSMTSNINGAFFTTLNVTANIFMERLYYAEIQVKEQASEEDAQADIRWYWPDNNHTLSINFIAVREERVKGMKFQQTDCHSSKQKVTLRYLTLGLWNESIFNPLRLQNSCSPKSWREARLQARA